MTRKSDTRSRSDRSKAESTRRSPRSPAHDRRPEDRATVDTDGRSDPIGHLHRHLGNQVVHALYERGDLQAKLTANSRGDRYEREADRIADTVMRKRSSSGSKSSRSDRRPKESPKSRMVTPPTELRKTLRSGGKPLPSSTRKYFEEQFNHDFSDVRIHTDSKAAEAAKALNAEAFTVGTDIAFAKGSDRLETAAGKRLLAHELTHVVQQRGRTPTVQRQAAENDDPAASDSFEPPTSPSQALIQLMVLSSEQLEHAWEQINIGEHEEKLAIESMEITKALHGLIRPADQ